jgi:hypothetical protein
MHQEWHHLMPLSVPSSLLSMPKIHAFRDRPQSPLSIPVFAPWERYQALLINGWKIG